MILSELVSVTHKFLWCAWRHRRDRCYPEVWGRGLAGHWHCTRCHPCGESFDRLFATIAPEEVEGE